MNNSDSADEIAEKYSRAYSQEHLQHLIESSDEHSTAKAEIVCEQFVSDYDKYGRAGRTFHRVIKCNGQILDWYEEEIVEAGYDGILEQYAIRAADYLNRHFDEELVDAAADLIDEAMSMSLDIPETLIYFDPLDRAVRALERVGADHEEIDDFRELHEKRKYEQSTEDDDSIDDGKEAEDPNEPDESDKQSNALNRWGGARRQKSALRTKQEERDFFILVSKLTLIWGRIIKFFKLNDYEPHSVEMIRASPIYVGISEKLRPDRQLLAEVLKRQDGGSADLGPQGFAIRQAASLMHIELSFNHLKRRYNEIRKSGISRFNLK